MKTLIIGYGNTLREDDALGIEAVRWLERARLPEEVDFIDCQQLTPELAEPIAQVERVVFIDAADFQGETAGTIHRQDLEDGPMGTARITHTFDPRELLALAEALYGHRPQAALFTVTGGSFNLAEGLTEAVQAALPRLIAAVTAWVGREEPSA